MLAGSFDAATIERIAGVAPKDNVLIATLENEAAIAELVRRLVESGAGVVDVRRHTADLESIFRGAA
jgi:hypothetical protein